MSSSGVVEAAREYARWESGGATWLITDLPPEDDDEAVDIMRDHMIPYETMSVANGVPDDPTSVRCMLGFWRKSIGARCSLACYELRGDSRTLVGVNICAPQKKGEIMSKAGLEGEKCLNIFKTVVYVESKCDVYSYLGLEELLMAVGLCVRTEYRGLGLGQRILAAREKLCKALGLTATSTLFTGVASQKLADRCGFTTVAEASLSELAAAGLHYSPDDHRVLKQMVKKYT